MTPDKSKTPLRDLDFIPKEYAENAERYRVDTVGKLYSNYVRGEKRAAEAFGIPEERIDEDLEPLMRRVEEYLGPEIVKTKREFTPPHEVHGGALPPYMKNKRESTPPEVHDGVLPSQVQFHPSLSWDRKKKGN